MKQWILCTILCLITACTSVSAAERNVVSWVDSENDRVLFTTVDIKRFDWEQQLFELNREKVMDLMAHDIGPHREFEVRDRDGLIYSGRFVSLLCSQTFSGPVIVPDNLLYHPPLYSISNGYGGDSGQARDERFAPRLRSALEKAGLLTTIDAKDPPSPIKILLADKWLTLRDGLQFLAVTFPETFVIGEQARVHLVMNKSQEQKLDFESIKAEVVITQPSGRSLCTKVLTIKPSDIGIGRYLRKTFICSFRLAGNGLRPGEASLVVRFAMNCGSKSGKAQVFETTPITLDLRAAE